MTKWRTKTTTMAQTMASPHKRNQTMMSQGEQTHLLPPIISMTWNPGAMLLSVTWQSNNK